LLLLLSLLLFFLPGKEGRNADENDTNARGDIMQRRRGKCVLRVCRGGETREERRKRSRSRGRAFLSAARDYDARERIFGEKKNGRRSTAKKKKMIGAVVAPRDDLNVNIYTSLVVWW